jgi:hypothetical protein
VIKEAEGERENKPATADTRSERISRSSSCWLQIINEKDYQFIIFLNWLFFFHNFHSHTFKFTTSLSGTASI